MCCALVGPSQCATALPWPLVGPPPLACGGALQHHRDSIWGSFIGQMRRPRDPPCRVSCLVSEAQTSVKSSRSAAPHPRRTLCPPCPQSRSCEPAFRLGCHPPRCPSSRLTRTDASRVPLPQVLALAGPSLQRWCTFPLRVAPHARRRATGDTGRSGDQRRRKRCRWHAGGGGDGGGKREGG